MFFSLKSYSGRYLKTNLRYFQRIPKKNVSNNFEVIQNAFHLGGREFVTFIQYGYFLEVDIEIEGLNNFNHNNLFKIFRNVNFL